MAKKLYRLGYWAAEHRKKVFGGTLCLLVLTIVLTLSFGISFKEEMTIPGTKSEQAGKLLAKEFPPVSSGGQIQIVMKAPRNERLDDQRNSHIIEKMVKEIQKDSEVVTVALPIELGNLNKEKTIGYATVTYKQPSNKVTEASKEKVLKSIKITKAKGIQTELAGDVAFSELEIGGITEALGVAVAYMILALTFTSFLAAGMPILSAVVGLGIGILLILAGTNFLDIPSFALSLAAMLGLAVGIDYALFIISRYRQQIAGGDTVKEAVAIATGTAGSAVVFAGATVIIALLGLSTTGIPFLTMMGISASLCVFVAILIAIILVPAILGALGHKMDPTRQNTLLRSISRFSNKKESGYEKWGKFILKRPLFISMLAVSLLLIISIPFFHMQLGLPNNGTKSEETTERRAYDLLAEAYGPGYHAPLILVAEKNQSDIDVNKALSTLTKKLKHVNGVENVSPAVPNKTSNVFMLSVTPSTGPDDPKTSYLVKALRGDIKKIANQNGLNLMLTGSTAVNIDISDKLQNALPIFAMLIVGFAFILLMLVFRSILVPLKAVLGFLLSLGATLGFVVFVIQDGHFIDLFGFPTASPVLSFLPVIVIGILFGLAMDYEVFLVSRMREEFTRTANAKQAILTGIKESGGVVTAAGLIMMAVFVGFMMAPDPIIKSMGFALTFGVLFDAFIIRMTLVPAIMFLLGDKAWYLPKWLDRILPNIDIEGHTISDKGKMRQKQVVNK
ncbi:MMPL family transporter [Exiguobacterium sp. 9-2]|uniref:MMPL family transporter n=1 Tax=Exiguobacterium sp. 9-2 TaxID=3112419 RepID=UPI002E3536E2|nr:MMPL family transporter [Exiguobacterium sp. 9-2]